MKRFAFSLGCVAAMLLIRPEGFGKADSWELKIESPTKVLEVLVRLDAGVLTYALQHHGSVAINASRLGLLTDRGDLSEGLELLEAGSPREHRETYTLRNSKRREVSTIATRQQASFTNAAGLELTVLFHVADDGFAFRYTINGDDTGLLRILEERSEFQLPSESRAWVQPMAAAHTGWSRTQPSYEELYFKDIPVDGLATLLEERQEAVEAAGNLAEVYPFVGWVFPALFRTADAGKWILLSEADIGRDYCASRLVQKEVGASFEIGFPMAAETVFGGPVTPEATLPWTTPWRLVVVGDSLSTLVASTLGTDLAAPAASSDTSWIRPGRASWSWVILKDDSMNFEVQKRFVRYAAEMSWEYTLVDADWNWKLSDQELRKLVEYAEEQGVGLLLWDNSSGSWNDTVYQPKSRLLTAEARETEFARIRELGIKGVKIDFFPGDGQSVMGYYHDLFAAAAKHHLLVNTHGTTLPRGWQRTYPHLMTMESVRGMEFITFTQFNANEAATHIAMLPFTRNVFDPMDFTPTLFSDLPGLDKQTLKGFEVALPVLLQSGLQHFAETDSGMAAEPAFVRDYMREVPTVWEDTRLLEGFPGAYVVLARRSASRWYVAGINATAENRSFTLSLPGLEDGGRATVITDHERNDQLVETIVQVSPGETWGLNTRPKGGFVIFYDAK